MPSLTRKSNATVIIPLLENPSNMSFGVSMPAQRNTTAAENSIIPGRIRSFISASTTSKRTTTTNTNIFLIHAPLFLFTRGEQKL